MTEIARATLLPPPSPLSARASVRAVQAESEPAVEAARVERRAQTPAFPTLFDARREDTFEIKGKQFRFRPYSGRSVTDGAAREAEPGSTLNGNSATGAALEDDALAVDILDGFGAEAGARNSSAFLASLIAQERPRQGLFNPQYEAASDAYRRAGASPSAVDNQPRVFSFAI